MQSASAIASDCIRIVLDRLREGSRRQHRRRYLGQLRDLIRRGELGLLWRLFLFRPRQVELITFCERLASISVVERQFYCEFIHNYSTNVLSWNLMYVQLRDTPKLERDLGNQ